MKVTELEGSFLRVIAANHFEHVDGIHDADGLCMLCPLCFKTNGGRVGTHVIICWQPKVPLEVHPGPGRWAFEGTSLEDLTLVAGSSSVLIKDGCGAHFFVRYGEVIQA